MDYGLNTQYVIRLGTRAEDKFYLALTPEQWAQISLVLLKDLATSRLELEWEMPELPADVMEPEAINLLPEGPIRDKALAIRNNYLRHRAQIIQHNKDRETAARLLAANDPELEEVRHLRTRELLRYRCQAWSILERNCTIYLEKLAEA
jgi:hypothetical protein